jgi:hypothetical protein
MVEQTSGEPQEDQHTLILASRVEDAAVFNSQGERIGHIEDLSIDRKDGRVVYAIMSFGGFLGIGKRFPGLCSSMTRGSRATSFHSTGPRWRVLPTMTPQN